MLRIAIAIFLWGGMTNVALAQVAEVEGEPITSVQVKSVNLIGNTILEEAEWQEAVEPYINREVSLEKLYEIRTEITNLYVAKGYTSSGAFIPPQEVTDGSIEVVAIEGELERIEIEGLDRLNESYVRSRLERAAGTPLNLNQLEAGLERLQRSELIERVEANLVEGSQPGQSVLQLNLVEAPPLTSELRFDNAFSPSIGEFGGTAIATHQNLLGFGDQLSTQYNLTEGLDRFQLAYSVPLNSLDGTVAVGYTDAEGEVTEDPFTALDIQSEYESFTLAVRQPLSATPTEEFALGLTAERIRTESLVSGFSFPFTEGLEDGRAVATILRFSQDWQKNLPTQFLSAQSQFNLGINALGATVTQQGIDSDFLSWQGQFQWVRALNEERDLLFVTRLNAQLSPDTLLPVEQLSVGGLGSVRGFRQNQQIADSGLVASAEMQVPLVGGRWGGVQVVPFLDFGTVWNNDRDVNGTNTLASVGLGLRFQLGDVVEARFDYGIPLTERENVGDSFQEDGGHLLIQLRPFRF